MIIGRPRIAAVHVGIPALTIHDAVASFVSGSRSWTLMHRNGDVLLLDLVEVAHGSVLGGVG